jgi:hypothetical protein
MNTQSKAYVTKFSSGLALSLLAFSGIFFLIPVAAPVFAANASLPSVSATGNNPALGGTAGQTFTLTVANPASNQFTVTAFTINAPAGWTITHATAGGFLSGVPSWTATGVTWTVSTFTVGTGAGIPPGSSDTLVFVATAATGTYPFSSTFTSKVQDASAVNFYTGPSFSILVIDPTTHITAVTPAAVANYIAGAAALSETATIAPVQAGVPIVFTAAGYAATFTGYSFSPATASTSSAGIATTVFQPSDLDCTTSAANCATAITAKIGTSTVAAASSAVITTVAGAPTKVSWTLASFATNGNHYITTEGTTVHQGGATTAVTGATMAAAGASFSISDKFGNAVGFATATLTWTVTLTALSGGGVFDATGLPSVVTCSNSAAVDPSGDWEVGVTALTPAVACPAAGTSANLPFNYFQSATYNSLGELSGSTSGTLGTSAFAGAGQSGLLVTSTFAAASPQPIAALPSGVTLPTGVVFPNEAAGDKVNVTATLAVPSTCGAAGNAPCPAQSGVPVYLMLDQVNSYETIAGAMDYGANSKLTAGFSNGLTYTLATTNSAGDAWGLFTLDTVATPTAAHAVFIDNVTAPTDASITHQLADSIDSTTVAASPVVTFIVTKPNVPVTFTVLTYYDSGLVTAATHAATGATIYVDVTISDTYGNVATNTAVTAIQINLAATGGTLSATTVYIPSGFADTFHSFGPITWTMPSAVGSVSLTAAGVLNGKQVSSTPNTLTVVSPLPTLAIISPVPLSGVIYSSVNSVVFSGQANVSIGYASAGPEAVKITSVTYSVDGGAAQAAPITSGYTITFSVAATMTAGLHSLVFNATDSLGNVASSTKYSVLVDVAAPTVAFTTKTGASVNYSSPVTATITVPQGDLNTTSVAASVNGTALPSSDVSISGTNSLGKSVTYTVTISGLAAGTDTIGLSASSLAGLTGTATSITVTVKVAFSSSVIITSATYGTLGSFTGISVSATNSWSSSQSLVVFAVWKNSAGQTVAVTTGGLTLAAGASGTTFAPLASALPSGSYSVSVFVITTANQPVSSPTSITASV